MSVQNFVIKSFLEDACVHTCSLSPTADNIIFGSRKIRVILSSSGRLYVLRCESRSPIRYLTRSPPLSYSYEVTVLLSVALNPPFAKECCNMADFLPHTYNSLASIRFLHTGLYS